MSVFHENIDIKIKEVSYLSLGTSNVSVAPRPYHALAFRIKGGAKFCFEKTTAETKEGDVFFMPAGLGYKAGYDKENTIIAVHFYSDLCGGGENYAFENNKLVSEKFFKLYKMWNEKHEGYYFKSLSLLCEIINTIIICEKKEVQTETKKSFEKAVQYMEENLLNREFSIESAVERSHMSSTWFRKLFCEKYGETPAKYITQTRLAHAEQLLALGNLSICEVAEQSGFSDAKYFSRCVKKHYGCPPSKLYKHF